MQSDQYQNATSYTHIEIRTYLNVRHIAFIICVIRPWKIGLICKLHFIEGYDTIILIFTQTQQLQTSNSAFLGGRFLSINHTQSTCNCSLTSPSSNSVVWAPWLLLQLIASFTPTTPPLLPPNHPLLCVTHDTFIF